MLLVALVAGSWSCGASDRSAIVDVEELRAPNANLVFISIDTTRADRLSLYGHDRPTTKALDALAPDAIVFDRAVSTAPSTAPSHMTMFTGLYPSMHGVMNFANPDKDREGKRVRRVLPNDIQTLAEILRDEGYMTAGFTAGGNTSGELGFARGFDQYFDRASGMTAGTGDRRFNLDIAIRWLRIAAPQPRPFFVFLHTYIPHSPYLPPPEFAGRYNADYDGDIPDWETASAEKELRGKSLDAFFWSFVDEKDPADREHLRALYDEELHYADSWLEGLLREFDRLGLADDTVFVITSDHGEQFYEHGGWKHHAQLWDELLHVPLVILTPATRGRGWRIAEPVSHIDLFATVLDLLDLGEATEQGVGRSMLPRIVGREPWREEPLVSEYLKSIHQEDDGSWEPVEFLRAIRVGEAKIIERRSASDPSTELYVDPAEQLDVSSRSEHAVTLERLHGISAAIEDLGRPLRTSSATAPTSERMLQELRDLGYIK